MNNPEIESMRQQIKPCDQNNPFIFISYSKMDAQKVYSTVINLQRMGFNVWIDKELSRNIGRDWQEGALEAISSSDCRAILFFMSENSMWSAPVCAELVWSTSETVRRYHNDEPLKLIPINTSEKWTPREEATCTWIQNTLSKDEGKKELKSDDYDVLKSVYVDEKYLSGMTRYRNRGDIAKHIQKVIFEPLGGNKVTIASLSDISTIESNIPEDARTNPVESLIERKIDKKISVNNVDKIVHKADILEASMANSQDTKLSGTTTLADFEKMCHSIDFCLYLRRIRGERKELYSKQLFDYAMTAILRGCDHKISEGSAPWNYCTYVVAAKPNFENPTLGASQFTWQSNSRKAVNIEGSGKLGPNSSYFQALSPTTTLYDLQHSFKTNSATVFSTKDNSSLLNVFLVLFGQM